MEVKINREIRNYTESMFFGLLLRQFVFSVLACGVAVRLYFLLKPHFGTETVSWVCISGAVPFVALDFVKYNEMTVEKFIWAWTKSEFLMPKKLVFHSTNTYYELVKPTLEQKEAYKNRTMIKTLMNLLKQDMGEMLGFTWDCIDISEERLRENNASIYVDKELQRVIRDGMEVLEI